MGLGQVLIETVLGLLTTTQCHRTVYRPQASLPQARADILTRQQGAACSRRNGSRGPSGVLTGTRATLKKSSLHKVLQLFGMCTQAEWHLVQNPCPNNAIVVMHSCYIVSQQQKFTLKAFWDAHAWAAHLNLDHS